MLPSSPGVSFSAYFKISTTTCECGLLENNMKAIACLPQMNTPADTYLVAVKASKNVYKREGRRETERKREREP